MKYSEILRENQRMGDALTGPAYRVAVLSNLTTDPLSDVLEYDLRSRGIPARVETGHFDNILQDSLRLADADLVIVFWELACRGEGLQQAVAAMSPSGIADVEEQIQAEIDLLLHNLRDTSRVLFNRFSSRVFVEEDPEGHPFTGLCGRLNQALADRLPARGALVPIDEILTRGSTDAWVDRRLFALSRMLYRFAFYRAYVELIRPLIPSPPAPLKKVVVFDCDGTLWSGILGEDGPEGIRCSPRDPEGAAFHQVQQLAVELAGQGVCVCLASKNNASDIEALLASHPDLVLRPEHIVASRINWEDKVGNLVSLADELRLGLDSFVFVDDSPFEIESVQRRLPAVATVQVPGDVSRYPDHLREALRCFQAHPITGDDRLRTARLQTEKQRTETRRTFHTLEDYLASLELQVDIRMDDGADLPRLAELTRRTNQFNLTTKRYAEEDIARFLERDDAWVFSLSGQDKFGSYGTVALCIVRGMEPGVAGIDSFLMSCRVLGRNIEFAFLRAVLHELQQRGLARIHAAFTASPKNEQTRSFYEQCGFSCCRDTGEEKHYRLELAGYDPAPVETVTCRLHPPS